MQTSSSETLPTDARERGRKLEFLPPDRPDLLGVAVRKLTFRERVCLRIVRASFDDGPLSRILPWCQRTIGQAWIFHSTRRLCHVVGLERIPQLDHVAEAPRGGADPQARRPSVLVVANHRSFFDMYVITARLVRGGLKQRIVFPVRSSFFYDRWLGLIVNFWMSFLSMYPPLFREKKKAAMNLLALDELAWLLHRGGVFAGLHPEGTRKQDDDPYTFLPAQPGVGRVIYKSRVSVVPVFINGLGNDLVRQVRSNFSGDGTPILVVYGEPIDFSDLFAEPASPKVYRQIADRCMEAIGRAGQEEKVVRRELRGSIRSRDPSVSLDGREL